jgi:hypothetical protein
VKRVANNAEVIGSRGNRSKNNNPQLINHIEGLREPQQNAPAIVFDREEAVAIFSILAAGGISASSAGSSRTMDPTVFVSLAVVSGR